MENKPKITPQESIVSMIGRWQDIKGYRELHWEGSFDEYLKVKGKLFDGLNKSKRKPDIPKISVLNRDDNSFEYFFSALLLLYQFDD